MKDFTTAIDAVFMEVRGLLIKKNSDYGDSAMQPLRIFSSADAADSIDVRIDDKLSRIKNRKTKNFDDDTLLDLIGYLVIKRAIIMRGGE